MSVDLKLTRTLSKDVIFSQASNGDKKGSHSSSISDVPENQNQTGQMTAIVAEIPKERENFSNENALQKSPSPAKGEPLQKSRKSKADGGKPLSEAGVPSDRDKGGGDTLSLTKSQNRSEEEEVRDEKNVPEEKSRKSKADGGKPLSEADQMRLQYYTANPIPEHSIGIFYNRTEAVRGPGTPEPLPGFCYARARPRKKANYYTDF